MKQNQNKKIKTYVLLLSQKYPQGHHLCGYYTGFPNLFSDNFCHMKAIWPKKHTIRTNYALWEKRFAEIDAGNAVLSVRAWSGKSYRSKQIVLKILTKSDGIGLQKLNFDNGCINNPVCERFIDAYQLAYNDGLCYSDWREWFELYDLNSDFAIIHFTNFRY